MNNTARPIFSLSQLFFGMTLVAVCLGSSMLNAGYSSLLIIGCLLVAVEKTMSSYTRMFLLCGTLGGIILYMCGLNFLSYLTRGDPLSPFPYSPFSPVFYPLAWQEWNLDDWLRQTALPFGGVSGAIMGYFFNSMI